MTKIETLFLIVFFDLAWFGCVFLAKSGYSNLSFILPLILLGFLTIRKLLTKKNVLLGCGISLLGISFDGLAIYYGLLTPIKDQSRLVPVWLVSIWVLYSFTMVKINSFKMPLWIASLMGLIFGPLSYYSGEAFEVLKLSNPNTIYIYAAFWAIWFPLVLKASKRYS